LDRRKSSSRVRPPEGDLLGNPVSLQSLLTGVLKIWDTDKVVLVNGKNQTPIYELQDGDEIQIFPRLDGE
jgi:molybdopterin converting factor small subunit